MCSYSDRFFLDEDDEFAYGYGEKRNLLTSVRMLLAFEPERGNQVIPNARDFFSSLVYMQCFYEEFAAVRNVSL